jgi:hypothetical protein
MKLIKESAPADKIAYHVPDIEVTLDDTKVHIIMPGGMLKSADASTTIIYHKGKVYEVPKAKVRKDAYGAYFSIMDFESLPEVK